jgi:hypothetical protein
MKITITGTTSGLGKACKEHFTSDEIEGLDRPDYDLDINLDAYVKTDFDVYINNAYSGFKQVELLYKLFDANKDRNCKIINIGSVCADRTYDRVYPYAIHKKALADACLQLQQVDSQCKVIHLRLGRMSTPMTAHRPGPKLEPDAVATYIENVLLHMPGEVVIKDLTIDNFFGILS